jgi:hypothetical protein
MNKLCLLKIHTFLLSIGYVNQNGGHLISDRPRYPEPPEGGMSANLDIDFDNKLSEEYAKIDDHTLRAAYDVARGDSPASPERLQSGMNPIYRGVPNYSKNEQKRARRSFVLCFCVLTIFLTSFLALGLGGFALANTWSIGTISASSEESSEDSLARIVAQLQLELDELRRNFSTHRMIHEERFVDVTQQLQGLQEKCPDSLPTLPGSSTPSSPTTPDTSTPSSTSTVPPTPAILVRAISLYENCTTVQETCTVTRTDAIPNSSPLFTSCATEALAVESDSNGYTADVFCTVSLEQLMPVSAILVVNNGRLQCVCHALEVASAVQTVLRDFQCEMSVVRCPPRIQFPAD